MRRMTRLLCLMLLFSLITFSCPLAEETDAPTGTPAPTPMLTAVPESALAPFNVVLPEDAHVEMAEGRITLVRGDSRVVAMVISRVPDDDPAAALPILMQDFDPKTSETMDFDAQPGFCILGGVVNDAFDDGEDKITLMVLADSGELLILSGYNLARDHHALYLFLTELLENVSMDGASVYVAEDAAAAASPEEYCFPFCRPCNDKNQVTWEATAKGSRGRPQTFVCFHCPLVASADAKPSAQ